MTAAATHQYTRPKVLYLGCPARRQGRCAMTVHLDTGSAEAVREPRERSARYDEVHQRSLQHPEEF